MQAPKGGRSPREIRVRGLPPTALAAILDPAMSTGNISTARRVTYATGFIELGLLAEALDELDAIEGADQPTLPVLLARTELYMGTKQWDRLVAVAQAAASADPSRQQAWIAWAWGQRRLTAIPDAKAVLLQAEQHHGETCALLHFNLACYECQLGDLEAAKTRLTRARAIGGEGFITMALDDADLEPLRDYLGQLA
jgi:hypothetical protein